ncbi:MAG: NosD domain-containing protein [Promethearchaeota archaeon]
MTNFNLSHTSTGLSVLGGRNYIISNIITNNCTKNGLSLSYCTNITIEKSTANFNDFGIELIEVNNATIKNNNMMYNDAGIYSLSSFFTLIHRNNLSYNENTGIVLDVCEYNNITQNFVCRNGGAGITLLGSNFNFIFNNSFNNNINHYYHEAGKGVGLQSSNNNTIFRNIFDNNSHAGITIQDCRYITLTENNFTNCGLNFPFNGGLPLVEDLISHSIDETNLINGKVLYYKFNEKNLVPGNFPQPGQLILINCSGTQIFDLEISYTTTALSLFYCMNDTIRDNTFTQNTYLGIISIQNSNSSIENNNITKNYNKFIDPAISFGLGVALSLVDCFNITISNNNISQNGMGIEIEDSYENNIINNYLYDNFLGGVYILSASPGSCDNNNLSRNLMTNCGINIHPTFFEPILFIDTSNLVNGKPIYYYYHINNLKPINFANAGQIILSGCTDSIISNLNLTKCTLALNILYCDNISLYNINASMNTAYGINLGFSNNCKIMNCSASQNLIGIEDVFGFNNTYEGNTLTESTKILMESGFFGAGFQIVYSTYSRFINNQISNNVNGILAQLCSLNNFTDNNLDGNSQYGIILSSCSNSSFLRNTIRNSELGLFIQNEYCENNSIYYNNFIGNNLQAQDNGKKNIWDDGSVGNFWDDYSGLDLDYNAIGDNPQTIFGTAYNQDKFPLFYRFDVDTDGDKFINLEEYLLGLDGYRTNVTNPDSDSDELFDFWEWKNSTNPLNSDTDSDRMPDGWEVFNILNPLNDADNITDVDTDFLINYHEFTNGTDPHNNDTDGDTFLDGIETGLGTKPLLGYWYPMPNLAVLKFDPIEADIGKPFVVNITITNNGIWDAKNVIIIIWIEHLNVILFNNTDNPIDLDVDEVYNDLIQGAELYQGGNVLVEIILDPNNEINETYSSKSGGFRDDNEVDNTDETILYISGELPAGIDPGVIIAIIVISVGVVGAISTFLVIRPRMKRRAALKKQIETAKNDVEIFETNIRSFAKAKLKGVYKSLWWQEGIPEYIRTTIESKTKLLTPKKLPSTTDEMESLDFIQLNSIITDKNNWEQVFSETFPDKNVIVENFERIRQFKRDLYEGNVTTEDFAHYPLYINAIRTYFTRGLNVFLSYSTLDSEHFNIDEIAKRLEAFPKIDKVFFWEADSGESIVTYMERTLRLSKVFVFFCSENSIKSKAVEDEWQAAFQMRKKGLMKIVPVYEQEDLIPFLLMPLLNVKFTKDNFDEFIQKLYEEILR